MELDVNAGLLVFVDTMASVIRNGKEFHYKDAPFPFLNPDDIRSPVIGTMYQGCLFELAGYSADTVYKVDCNWTAGDWASGDNDIHAAWLLLYISGFFNTTENQVGYLAHQYLTHAVKDIQYRHTQHDTCTVPDIEWQWIAKIPVPDRAVELSYAKPANVGKYYTLLEWMAKCMSDESTRIGKSRTYLTNTENFAYKVVGGIGYYGARICGNNVHVSDSAEQTVTWLPQNSWVWFGYTAPPRLGIPVGELKQKKGYMAICGYNSSPDDDITFRTCYVDTNIDKIGPTKDWKNGFISTMPEGGPGANRPVPMQPFTYSGLCMHIGTLSSMVHFSKSVPVYDITMKTVNGNIVPSCDYSKILGYINYKDVFYRLPKNKNFTVIDDGHLISFKVGASTRIGAISYKYAPNEDNDPDTLSIMKPFYQLNESVSTLSSPQTPQGEQCYIFTLKRPCYIYRPDSSRVITWVQAGKKIGVKTTLMTDVTGRDATYALKVNWYQDDKDNWQEIYQELWEDPEQTEPIILSWGYINPRYLDGNTANTFSLQSDMTTDYTLDSERDTFRFGVPQVIFHSPLKSESTPTHGAIVTVTLGVADNEKLVSPARVVVYLGDVKIKEERLNLGTTYGKFTFTHDMSNLDLYKDGPYTMTARVCDSKENWSDTASTTFELFRGTPDNIPAAWINWGMNEITKVEFVRAFATSKGTFNVTMQNKRVINSTYPGKVEVYAGDPNKAGKLIGSAEELVGGTQPQGQNFWLLNTSVEVDASLMARGTYTIYLKAFDGYYWSRPIKWGDFFFGDTVPSKIMWYVAPPKVIVNNTTVKVLIRDNIDIDGGTITVGLYSPTTGSYEWAPTTQPALVENSDPKEGIATFTLPEELIKKNRTMQLRVTYVDGEGNYSKLSEDILFADQTPPRVGIYDSSIAGGLTNYGAAAPLSIPGVLKKGNQAFHVYATDRHLGGGQIKIYFSISYIKSEADIVGRVPDIVYDIPLETAGRPTESVDYYVFVPSDALSIENGAIIIEVTDRYDGKRAIWGNGKYINTNGYLLNVNTHEAFPYIAEMTRTKDEVTIVYGAISPIENIEWCMIYAGEVPKQNLPMDPTVSNLRGTYTFKTSEYGYNTELTLKAVVSTVNRQTGDPYQTYTTAPFTIRMPGNPVADATLPLKHSVKTVQETGAVPKLILNATVPFAGDVAFMRVYDKLGVQTVTTDTNNTPDFVLSSDHYEVPIVPVVVEAVDKLGKLTQYEVDMEIDRKDQMMEGGLTAITSFVVNSKITATDSETCTVNIEAVGYSGGISRITVKDDFGMNIVITDGSATAIVSATKANYANVPDPKVITWYIEAEDTLGHIAQGQRQIFFGTFTTFESLYSEYLRENVIDALQRAGVTISADASWDVAIDLFNDVYADKLDRYISTTIPITELNEFKNLGKVQLQYSNTITIPVVSIDQVVYSPSINPGLTNATVTLKVT
jgi:hypothetical protein